MISLAIDAINSKIDNNGRDAVTALVALAAWAELSGTTSITAKSRVDRIKRRIPPALEQAIEQLQAFGERSIWLPYRRPTHIPELELLFENVLPSARTSSQQTLQTGRP